MLIWNGNRFIQDSSRKWLVAGVRQPLCHSVRDLGLACGFSADIEASNAVSTNCQGSASMLILAKPCKLLRMMALLIPRELVESILSVTRH